MPSTTFTASNDTTALSDHVVIAKESASTHMGPQIARFFATAAASGAASSLELALVRAGAAIARFTGTATPTVRRADSAGTGGDYICDVVWAESGNSKFDLLGSRESPAGAGKADSGINSVGSDNGAVWMLGCLAIGGATTLTITWEVTRVT